MNNLDAESPTFPVKLTYEAAWVLRSQVRPGICPPNILPDAALLMDKEVRNFRHKVDDVILRFNDEEDVFEKGEIEVDLTENEGWIIDASIKYDGPTGWGTDLLTQVFRGFWSLRTGLPATLVEEPQLINNPREDPLTLKEDTLLRYGASASLPLFPPFPAEPLT